MRIGELMAQLPEYPDDEALLAIESVVLNPANDSALVRCHLTHLFRLTVQLDGAAVSISAADWRPVSCTQAAFLGQLKRVIHEIDAAMEAGTYQQAPVKPMLIFDDRPEPPASFDLPVWDQERGVWYDAEY